MSQIEVFNNEEFGSIRVIEENGKYLFCGLGHFTRNYTQTTKRGLLTTNKG